MMAAANEVKLRAKKIKAEKKENIFVKKKNSIANVSQD